MASRVVDADRCALVCERRVVGELGPYPLQGQLPNRGMYVTVMQRA